MNVILATTAATAAQSAPPGMGRDPFAALASCSDDLSTNIEYGVGLWIRKGSDYPQPMGGISLIHGELT